MNSVTVKFFNENKGFGFFQQESGPDVFVHISTLIKSGFDMADMRIDTPAVVQFKSTPKGLVATRIESIGKKKMILRRLVDHHDAKYIMKVDDLLTGGMHFEVHTGAVDGEQEGVDLYCLADARKQIGKIMPVEPTESKPTNIVGNGPQKGLSPPAPNGFKNAAGKKKKAA